MRKILIILILLSPLLAFAPPKIMIEEKDELLEKIIQCESEGIPSAKNTKEVHGESIGILQFRRDTFNEQMIKYSFIDVSQWEESDFENALWDATIQIRLAKLMIADGLGDRWACYKKVLNKNND